MKKKVFFLAMLVMLIGGSIIVGMNGKKKINAEKILKQMKEEARECWEEPGDPWGEGEEKRGQKRF